MGDEEDKIARAVNRAVWETEMAEGIRSLAVSVDALAERVATLEKRYLIVCAVLVILGQAVGMGLGEIISQVLGNGTPTIP